MNAARTAATLALIAAGRTAAVPSSASTGPACASGHRVYVRYQGTTGHPAVAIDKAYR